MLRILGVVGLVALCAVSAGGDELSDAQGRIAALEKQVRMLQARVVMLEAELKAARADATEAGGPEAAEALPADVSAADAPEADEPASDEQQDSAESPPYQGVKEIFRDIPEKFRPHPKTGWEPFQFEELRDWAKSELRGKPFEARLRLAKHSGIRVKEADGSAVFTNSFEFERQVFSFMGVQVVATVKGATEKTDLDAWEKFEAMEKRPSVRARGTIAGVILNKYPSNGNVQLILSLGDLALE